MTDRHIVVLLTLALVLAAPAGNSRAQEVKGLSGAAGNTTQPPVTSGAAPSPFLIEPEVEIKGDRIKRETFRSQAVGQNKNWDLDIGRFQGQVNEDPNRLIEDLDNQDYSGMRLRLPFRGRTGQ